MAYSIEFGLAPGAYFYAEILIRNRNSGAAMLLTGVGHQMVGYRDDFDACAWGPYVPPYAPPQPESPTPAVPPTPISVPAAVPSPGAGYGWVLASDATGEITYPAPGILAIAIPANRFWWGGVRRRSLRFDLLAIPANPDFSCLLASGTISFEGRAMNPRITLDAYPLYPNSITAGTVGSIIPAPGSVVQSAWLKAAEAMVPGSVTDLATNIPGSLTDPIAQEWRNPWFAPSGPVATFYQARNSLTPVQMASLFALALTYI